MQAWGLWFGVGSIALFGLACGSKGSDSGGTGGSPAATGGASAGGATSAAGGTTSAAGGTTSAAGGTTSAGSGGVAPGGGGGGAAFTKAYNFDTTVEAWKIQYTSNGVIGAGPSLGMMAPLIAIGDPGLTLAWTGTDGNPTPPPGAIQVNIPYSTASQYVGIGISLATKVDLTDKVLRANVKVVSGLGDPADLMTNPGGAKLYVKTGAGYLYAAGAYTNVTAIGTWIPILFDLGDPSYVAPSEAGAFDPSDVREIGIQLDTGGTTITAAPAIDLIDSVTY